MPPPWKAPALVRSTQKRQSSLRMSEMLEDGAPVFSGSEPPCKSSASSVASSRSYKSKGIADSRLREDVRQRQRAIDLALDDLTRDEHTHARDDTLSIVNSDQIGDFSDADVRRAATRLKALPLLSNWSTAQRMDEAAFSSSMLHMHVELGRITAACRQEGIFPNNEACALLCVASLKDSLGYSQSLAPPLTCRLSLSPPPATPRHAQVWGDGTEFEAFQSISARCGKALSRSSASNLS